MATAFPRPVDASFADSLGTEVVTILVGPEEKKYIVHKNLLVSQSDYFDKALNGGFREAGENIIHLEEDDPAAIALLVAWLYRSVIPGPASKSVYSEGAFPPSNIQTILPVGGTKVQIQPYAEPDPNRGGFGYGAVIETNIFHSILAHPVYSKFSCEELRLADYYEGRRDSSSPSSIEERQEETAPAPTRPGGLFLDSRVLAGNPPSHRLFGTTTTGGGNLFGGGGPGQLFGGPTSGANPVTVNPVGTSTNPIAAQANGGGLFGGLGGGATGGLYGPPQNTATANTAGGGLFGGPGGSTPGGLFGRPQNTSTSNNPGGGVCGGIIGGTTGVFFGSHQRPAATTSNSGGGLFGGSNGSLFGNTQINISASGQPLSGGTTGGSGLFGTSQSTSTQPPGTGLFGSTQGSGTTPTGGATLFGGMSTGGSGGLFGNVQRATNPTQSSTTSSGSSAQPSQSSNIFGHLTNQSVIDSASGRQPGWPDVTSAQSQSASGSSQTITSNSLFGSLPSGFTPLASSAGAQASRLFASHATPSTGPSQTPTPTADTSSGTTQTSTPGPTTDSNSLNRVVDSALAARGSTDATASTTTATAPPLSSLSSPRIVPFDCGLTAAGGISTSTTTPFTLARVPSPSNRLTFPSYDPYSNTPKTFDRPINPGFNNAASSFGNSTTSDHQTALLNLVLFAETTCWPMLYNAAITEYTAGERFLFRPPPLDHITQIYERTHEESSLRTWAVDTLASFKGEVDMSGYMSLLVDYDGFLEGVLRKLREGGKTASPQEVGFDGAGGLRYKMMEHGQNAFGKGKENQGRLTF